MSKLKIGIIGCGAISDIYLQNLTTTFAHLVDVVACADTVRDHATKRAGEFTIPRVLSPDELIADPTIEIVLNTTPPRAHAPIAIQALNAGKHVWVEKPLALSRDDARTVLEAAQENDVHIGCAPDSAISAGQQTVRKLIDEGAIGRVVAGNFTCVVRRSPETFHPNPEFFFKAGAGPMLDLGVYYITALVSLLGPVKSVRASATSSFPTRTISSDRSHGLRGQVIKVEVPTHYTGTIEFESGAIVSFVTSWDIRGLHSMKDGLEFYGTEGSIRMHDRNAYSATKVGMSTVDGGEWSPVETPFLDYGVVRKPGELGSLNARGIGLVEMGVAARNGQRARLDGTLAMHVLDVMLCIDESAELRRAVEPTSSYTRARPMPAGVHELIAQ